MMDNILSGFLPSFWQVNVELSLLLCVILLARFLIRKTTKNYNAYLLWLSIPIGLGIAKLVALIEFKQPPAEAINQLIVNYVVTPSQNINHWSYLLYLWGFVAVILLLRLIKQHKSLRKDLKAIMVPHNLKVESKYPIIGISKKDFSPAVYGFIKPRIYFPVQLKEELTEEQISLIIKHEEHHISQKHLWLNLLWDILVCLVWFNPLIYISRQNFRHDQEVYCDYLVLNRAPDPEHKTYGHALLSTVSATHSVSLLCSWKMFNQLEERIMSIKNVKKPSNKIALMIGGLAIVACTSLYAMNSSSFKVHQSGKDQRIEWNDNGTRYINHNGNLKIIENGKSREMTAKEEARFKEHYEAMEVNQIAAEEELAIAELKRFEAEKELEISEEAMAKAMVDMELAQLEMEKSIEIMEKDFEDLEQSHILIEENFVNGQLSKEEYKKLKIELEKAQQQLKRNSQLYKEEIKRANEILKKTNQELQRSKASKKYIGLINESNSLAKPLPVVRPIMPRKPETPPKPKKMAFPTKQAIPMSTVPPRYPVEAVKKGIQGSVNFKFDLNSSGEPSNIRVTNATPDEMFVEEAHKAVQKWVFKTDGYPRKDMRYKMDFRLE